MRVLVVEDDPSIALIEREALEREGFEVSVTASGADALGLARSVQPDLIILDHGLPDIDGIEVLREIRSASRVAIIVVTGRSEEAVRVESLEAGADDYVIKPFSTPELVARVRAVLRRVSDPRDATGVLEFMDLRIDDRARKVFKDGVEVALTRIEYNVLRMLMARAGEAVDREDIARAIWSLPAERIGKSLDVHMSVLRKKLGDDPKEPRYIQTVRSFGFRMSAE